jgi:hypothetical protein
MTWYQVAVVIVEASNTQLYPTHVTYFDPVQRSLIPYEYPNWPEAFATFMAADWELMGADVTTGAWTFSFRKAIPGPASFPYAAAPPALPFG